MVPASSCYSITLCTDPLDPNVFVTMQMYKKKQRRAISLNYDKLGNYIQSRPSATENDQEWANQKAISRLAAEFTSHQGANSLVY